MKKLFLLLGIFSLLNGFAGEDSLEDYNISFELPINWACKERVSLSVQIPSDYQSLQPASTWAKASIIEFIPKSETEEKFSEIITVSPFIGKRVSAHKFIELLKNQIMSLTFNSSVLLNEKKNEKDYQEAILVIKYSQDGKDEVLGARYISGPYDCVGMQYTIHLSQDMNEQQAVEKITQFFKSSLSIVKK